MYILVDNDRMMVLHKYPNYFTLADLAWIECSNSYSIFGLYNVKGFRDYTEMELGLLYRNITGSDHSNLNRFQLLQVLHDLCMRLPESDVVPTEVDRQAAKVAEGDVRRWRYVKGASTPAAEELLFEPDGLSAPANETEESEARAGKLPALKATAQPQAAGTGPVTPVASTVTAGTTSSAPKRGTAKITIWSVADRLWEEAGKPQEKEDVLKIRKAIMQELEVNEGIKRTSSSSELGQWHKTRAPY